MTVLVDSDILIEVLRGKDPNIVANWLAWSSSTTQIMYSPVSEAEVWAGARASEHESITNLFQALHCAPIDAETGRLAGDYLRQYGKSHSLELATR